MVWLAVAMVAVRTEASDALGDVPAAARVPRAQAAV